MWTGRKLCESADSGELMCVDRVPGGLPGLYPSISPRFSIRVRWGNTDVLVEKPAYKFHFVPDRVHTVSKTNYTTCVMPGWENTTLPGSAWVMSLWLNRLSAGLPSGRLWFDPVR